MVISPRVVNTGDVLGALLGIAVWTLGFLAVALGFFGLFVPGLGVAFDVLFTWTQVPVVALVYATLYREGVPGGVGELKTALAWAGDDEDEADLADAPFNAALVGLELGAAILVTVGLLFCTLFSMSIGVALLTTFGEALADPSGIAIANVEPSDAFLTFVAGGVLWQVALFAEGFERT